MCHPAGIGTHYDALQDVDTTTPEKNLWSLVYDLVFSVQHPILVAIGYLVATLVIAALVAFVVRFWRGDRFELGPLKIERSESGHLLEESLDALSKDDRLKANVLWSFRERLNEANRVIIDGIDEPAVRQWCRGILTDVIMALSEGGHDRHRASVWIRAGDRLRIYSGMGFRQDAVDSATLPFASIAGSVLRTGTSHKSTDVDADGAFCPKPRSGQPYKSLIAVPIKNPFGTTIAALCVDAEARGYFDQDHEFFTASFADLIGLLLAQVIAEDE